MILYTEEQLHTAYAEYQKLHIRKNVPFLKLEDFRILFEYLMENRAVQHV